VNWATEIDTVAPEDELALLVTPLGALEDEELLARRSGKAQGQRR